MDIHVRGQAETPGRPITLRQDTTEADREKFVEWSSKNRWHQAKSARTGDLSGVEAVEFWVVSDHEASFSDCKRWVDVGEMEWPRRVG